ncbi:hypothetical protein HDV02_006645 [Globomyces sp. JEL0801]|nr:hypothetical protein HDV02_006645 [Globomyces sp. JEL0801]
MTLKRINLKAVGVASQDSFVMEALPEINRIVNQEYVLAKYAQTFEKTVEDIKKALETPPEIRFSSVTTFNAFVDVDIQLHDERTNGWFWAGQDNGGFDWSNYLNVNERYFPTNISTLSREAKRNHQVYFITIVLHELTHWLRFKLEAISPQNPYPGEPTRKSGENLELDLLGGRMASYYFVSHNDEFKIDGVVLLLSERGQEHPVWQSPCRMLSESYFKFFFEDMEKLLEEVQTMRRDLLSGMPDGASLKAPLCGCETQGNASDSSYQINIAKRPMGDRRG